MPLDKKNLTLVNLLYVIGKSERSLSSSKIEDETKLSKYVFEMLEKLAPIGRRNRDKLIFVIEEILSGDKKTKYESIKNLEKALEIDWNVTEEDIEKEYVKVEKNSNEYSSDEVIEIHYKNSRRKITITMTDTNIQKDKQLAIVQVCDDGDSIKSTNLFIDKNRKKQSAVYTIKENHNPVVNYLDITYEKETQKIISLLEKDRIPDLFNTEVIKEISQEDWNKELRSTSKIENIKNDRSKWRYSLNIRGFLLYLNLLNYNNNMLKKIKISNLQNHSSIIRVKQVISNSTLKNKFIFLKSWEKFEENGFKVIEKLLEIANEFDEKQLEIYDDRNLLIRVTERYLFEIDKHFSKYGSFSYSHLTLSQETESILNQYRLMILEFLEKELILYTNGIYKQIRYIKSGIE